MDEDEADDDVGGKKAKARKRARSGYLLDDLASVGAAPDETGAFFIIHAACNSGGWRRPVLAAGRRARRAACCRAVPRAMRRLLPSGAGACSSASVPPT